MDDQRRAVIFGTYDIATHPRVEVIIEGLEASGFAVTELNEPLGFDTARRVQLARQPWRAPALVIAILRAWWRLRRRAGDRSPDVVLVGYLGQFDVHLARRLYDAPIVLDYLVGLGDTATDRRAGSLVARLLGGVDRRAARAADIVMVDTASQAAMCPSPGPPLVVQVGAPGHWFRDVGGAGDGGSEPLAVVFFGLYTPLQGTPVIAGAIAALADRDDIRFTMIGDGQDRAECERFAAAGHVTWIDWIDADDLAAEVARHDVCLGIFGTTPKAGRVVPNKVFQGAAAGCAVITSDTAPQREALDEAAIFCAAGDPAALARAVVSLADDRELLGRRRRSARALAESFRPAAVVAPLLARLDAVSP